MDQAWPVKVRFTRRALRQMAEILDYIESQSPQGAETVKRRLQAGIGLLADHPDAGRVTNRGNLRRAAAVCLPAAVVAGNSVHVGAFVWFRAAVSLPFPFLIAMAIGRP